MADLMNPLLEIAQNLRELRQQMLASPVTRDDFDQWSKMHLEPFGKNPCGEITLRFRLQKARIIPGGPLVFIGVNSIRAGASQPNVQQMPRHFSMGATVSGRFSTSFSAKSVTLTKDDLLDLFGEMKTRISMSNPEAALALFDRARTPPSKRTVMKKLKEEAAVKKKPQPFKPPFPAPKALRSQVMGSSSARRR